MWQCMLWSHSTWVWTPHLPPTSWVNLDTTCIFPKPGIVVSKTGITRVHSSSQCATYICICVYLYIISYILFILYCLYINICLYKVPALPWEQFQLNYYYTLFYGLQPLSQRCHMLNNYQLGDSLISGVNLHHREVLYKMQLLMNLKSEAWVYWFLKSTFSNAYTADE